MFNMKYKFVHLLLFDVKFLFPKKHTFQEQKRTAVDRRVPLVPDFKLTRKITCYLREVAYPVYKYIKISIDNKRYKTKMPQTF